MRQIVVSACVAILTFGVAVAVAAQPRGNWAIIEVEGKTPDGGALPLDGKLTALVGPFQDASSRLCYWWGGFFEGFFERLLNKKFQADCRAIEVRTTGRGSNWMMLPVEEEGKISTIMIGAFRDNSGCARWHTFFQNALTEQGRNVLSGGCRNTTVQY